MKIQRKINVLYRAVNGKCIPYDLQRQTYIEYIHIYIYIYTCIFKRLWSLISRSGCYRWNSDLLYNHRNVESTEGEAAARRKMPLARSGTGPTDLRACLIAKVPYEQRHTLLAVRFTHLQLEQQRLLYYLSHTACCCCCCSCCCCYCCCCCWQDSSSKTEGGEKAPNAAAECPGFYMKTQQQQRRHKATNERG